MKKKRRMTGLAALLLLLIFIFPMTVLAAEDTGQSSSQLTLTVSVSGYPADVEDGQAQTTLPDGTRVTVQGEDLPEGLLFVVEPLEGDTLAWVESCLEGKGTNIRAYDIYFLDGSGNRYEVTEPIKVSFSLNGEYQRPVVYYISERGETQQMETSVTGDQISFTTDHNSYYALAEQVGTEETGSSGNPSGSTGGTGGQTGSGTSGNVSGKGSPKTGDETEPGLWTGMMAVSVILVISLMAKARKKKV